jgi:diguanylate cyclase (GGDEF)-like protein
MSDPAPEVSMSRTDIEMRNLRKRLVEYEIAIDLLSQVAETTVESDVVARVFELFDQLCAPAWIRYVPINDGEARSATTFSASGDETAATAPTPEVPAGDCSLAPSGNGFVLKIARGASEPLALIEVEELRFPEHLEHYLALAPSIADVLALAIHTARLYERLELISITDDLTGVPNRRAGIERIEAECARARRSGGSVSVIMLDVDVLKSVNDRYGQAAGDEVLKEVARRVKATIRTYDVVARLHGGTFLVLAPGEETSGALSMAERIRATVEDVSVATGGSTHRVTVSAGVASLDSSDETADALIARADTALSAAQNAGGNLVTSA